jgi:hypothetical protein
MEQITRAAVGYWHWNERAFQSVKASLGYWVAATCAVVEVILWLR